jgi:hypothetical protein
MPYVDVYVEPTEVLEDMSDEDVRAELERREAKNAPLGSCETTDRQLLERVWMHFRCAGDAPEALREYIWRVLGKCL